MKLSMASAAYGVVRWLPSYTIEETVNRVADIGYDGIEIAAAGMGWPRYLNKEKRRKLIELLKSRSLEVSAICVFPGGHLGLNPASPLEVERKEAIRYLKESIELAADLGAEVALWVAGYQVFGTPYDEAWRRSRDTLLACVKDAEERDVIIAVEPTPVDSNIVNSADDALKMMREADSKNVKVMFDTFHVLTKTADQATPIDYVKKMKQHLVHMHISDVNRQPPGTQTDFKPLINALKKIGYDRYLSAEIWTGPSPDNVAFQAFQYLKPLVK